MHEGDEPDAVVDLFDPDFWPEKTWLKLIFLVLKQIRPQAVTTMALPGKGCRVRPGRHMVWEKDVIVHR